MPTYDAVPMRLDETNETVHSGQAYRIVDLAVKNGGDIPAAAKELGLTAAELRSLNPAIREKIKAIIETHEVSDDLVKRLTKARLLEFGLQDEDKGLALAALREIKKIHGMDQVPTVQLNFTRPPEAEAAAAAIEEEK